jgi:hypothetical protein
VGIETWHLWANVAADLGARKALSCGSTADAMAATEGAAGQQGAGEGAAGQKGAGDSPKQALSAHIDAVLTAIGFVRLRPGKAYDPQLLRDLEGARAACSRPASARRD